MNIFTFFMCCGRALAFHATILSDWDVMTFLGEFEFEFEFENSRSLLHMPAYFCAYACASVDI
jgi:hypothetical protein